MLNKVILIGNLGADPETRQLPSGGSVTTIGLATTRRWKDKLDGERKSETEWHKVVFFSRLAEVVEQYLKKGSQIYIEGRIKTRKWQDANGQDRYATEIIAEEMNMLGGKGEAGSSKPAPDKEKASADFDDYDDSDIPF